MTIFSNVLNQAYSCSVSDPPINFLPFVYCTGDGSTIKSDNVELTSNDLTNNGTFTCSVSNGLGSEVVLAFDLGVYGKIFSLFCYSEVMS